MKKDNLIMKTRLYEDMRKRKAQVEKIILRAKKELSNTPPGSIEVSRHKNSVNVQFYHVLGKSARKYLKKNQDNMKAQLINKEYYKKVYEKATREKMFLDNFLKEFDGDPYVDIYKSMHSAKKPFLEPLIIDDETFLAEWENFKFEGKGFDDEDKSTRFTKKGERVRSKSEIWIADTLLKNNIPYRYECPLKLKSGRVVYPDFTILDMRNRKIYIWEHLGKMDDVDYVKKTIKKINEYEKSGFMLGDNLILTFETADMIVNTKTIEDIVYRYFKE